MDEHATTTLGAAEPPPPSAAATAPPRAYRSAEDSYLGGVAGGLAAHLGLDPLWVRLFFLLTAAFGLGIVLYGALWLVMPLELPSEEAPGLAAARRQGKRPRTTRGLRDTGPLVAIACFAFGLAVLLDALLGGPALFWPVMLGLVGLGLLWRQADEVQRERWLDTTGRLDLRRIFVGSGGVAAYARLAAGASLLVVALVIFAAQTGRLGEVRMVLVAGVLGVLGLALTLGPWLLRLATELTAEREARVRSEERADVAAHLHDSVLQTLALIQKNAQDPAQVSRLARAQERDLREWMYGAPAAAGESLSAALRSVAADVEDGHGVPVELVTVGDVAMTEDLVPLVHAAREAVVNAAKHSGAAKIDVYAEVGTARAEVFVRDRGRGFDPDQVAADRLGVRHSIRDRMERHGGSAQVRSAPGEGTEVRLSMPVARGDHRGPDDQSGEQTPGRQL